MLIIQRLDGARHERESFDCGEPSLNLYLHGRATQHHRAGVATTHVLIDDNASSRICGYYSLAAAQMSLTDLTSADQRRLPRYPLPVARLARLAVALPDQRRGLGEVLLQDAVKRCLDLRRELGIHALLVDALHDKAAGFYRSYGFRESSASSLTLYLPLGKS